jgi:hypothetical protein
MPPIRLLFHRFCPAGLCPLSVVFLAATAIAAPPTSTETIDVLLSDLSADAYTTRRRAEQRLLGLAGGDAELEATLLRRLDVALDQTKDLPPRDDLEGYLAKRRLHQALRQQRLETRLDRFLHDPSFDDDSFSDWPDFRRYAGTGVTSRLLFTELTRRHAIAGTSSPSLFAWVPASPDAIRREDTALWCAALVAACRQESAAAQGGLIELTAALRCDGGGPMPETENERRVLANVVSHYLRRPELDSRDRIVIGMRFGCRHVTLQACHRVLSDPEQSPSRIVTALLAASVLDAAEIDAWIQQYRCDHRVSHTWRSMTPPKTTRRTQVRDVALAIELHRAGIDPRSRGFGALVADPVLVFRPYSLGFESEAARHRAHGGHAPASALR